MLRRTLSRLGAANAALVATFVVLAGGGIALAAVRGPVAPNGHPGPGAAFADPSSEAGESEAPETEEPETDSDEPKSGQRTPSPSLTGLCHAVQAGATSNPGKAIENPAFSVLVDAAGGRGNVAAYCTDLIGPPKAHGHGKPAGLPGHHPGPNHSLPSQADGHH